MGQVRYCVLVRTIEEIRMANYQKLVAGLSGEPKDGDVAAAFGISKVYAWQIRNGKRLAIRGPFVNV